MVAHPAGSGRRRDYAEREVGGRGRPIPLEGPERPAVRPAAAVPGLQIRVGAAGGGDGECRPPGRSPGVAEDKYACSPRMSCWDWVRRLAAMVVERRWHRSPSKRCSFPIHSPAVSVRRTGRSDDVRPSKSGARPSGHWWRTQRTPWSSSPVSLALLGSTARVVAFEQAAGLERIAHPLDGRRGQRRRDRIR